MDYVIVGSGVAGVTAARTIREHDKTGEITIYGFEFHPLGLYPRKNLARELATGIGAPDDLLTAGVDDLAQEGITLIYEDVIRIFPQLRQVLHPRHSRKPYDRLLLATGAIPRLVNAPGLHYIGVHQLRNYEDAALIEAWMPLLQRVGVVVIGGGILGMDVAYALNRRGVPTTLVARENQLGMPHLTQEDALLAEERLREVGVAVILNDTVTAYLSDDERALDRVMFSSGRIIPARMALCAVGVHPCTDILAESGITLDENTHAIRTNRMMQTSYPNIYAAGNCAMVDGQISWNWEQAAEQGRIAGLNMVGQIAEYDPTTAHHAVFPLVLETVSQTAQ